MSTSSASGGKVAPNDASPLYDKVKRTVGSAVFRAMQVAGDAEGSYPSKLSQQGLSQRSGVARSTISKYIEAKDNPDSVLNPDLKTLCRIARALNITPAMLLLTPEDWSRLAQAATFLREAVPDANVQRISAGMADSKAGPAVRAQAGLQLARLFGVYRDFSPIAQTEFSEGEVRQELLDDQALAATRQRQGIFVATSLPPLRELPPSQHAPLLSLCANLGASTNLD